MENELKNYKTATLVLAMIVFVMILFLASDRITIRDLQKSEKFGYDLCLQTNEIIELTHFQNDIIYKITSQKLTNLDYYKCDLLFDRAAKDRNKQNISG